MASYLDKYLDKFLNLVYSKNKTIKYLFAIFIAGFLLRIIAAINLGVAADDMHFTVHAINFLQSGKLVVYDQSASLWYYLTDIFYGIFGMTQLGSRFAPVLFGSLSIFIIFFLTKEFFGEKSALIAAVLLAFSPFHIKNTLAEMDVTVMFFAFFSIFMFMKAIRLKQLKLFIISGILLGLGILTKVYALLFIPVLIVYFFFVNKKQTNKYLSKDNLKPLIVFLAVIFIFCIPALTHNYLLYKDKGFMDFLFTNTLGLGRDVAAQYYSWDAGWGHSADLKGFFFGNSELLGKTPSFLTAMSYFVFSDPITFILGLFGLIYLLRKKKYKYPLFMFLVLLFLFVYMASRVLLPKHYLFLLMITVPMAAVFVNTLDNYIKNKSSKFRLRYIIILIVILQLFLLGMNSKYIMPHMYSKSSIAQLMDYKQDNILSNSLIIADSRIYRGQIHWALNQRNYLEASYFASLLNFSDRLTGNKLATDIYFIECVSDDCGWGTIKDQPDFNNSMESIVDYFKNNSKIKKEIYCADKHQPYFPFISKKDEIEFRVYKTTFMLNPQIFSALKSTQTWFLYPIGYDESIQPIFDKYKVHSGFDYALDKIAHFIIYISILSSFISVLYVIYLLAEEQ